MAYFPRTEALPWQAPFLCSPSSTLHNNSISHRKLLQASGAPVFAAAAKEHPSKFWFWRPGGLCSWVPRDCNNQRDTCWQNTVLRSPHSSLKHTSISEKVADQRGTHLEAMEVLSGSTGQGTPPFCSPSTSLPHWGLPGMSLHLSGTPSFALAARDHLYITWLCAK